MGNVREAVETYLRDYPPALKLFQKLIEVGHVYLIGGVLREYRDNETIRELRDADFIIDVENDELWQKMLAEYQPEGNHFDGYKFHCENNFLVDIWEIDKTWAYRNSVVPFEKDNYLESLPKTVFLNLDSIIYDLNTNTWYDEIYQHAIESKVLDIVLKDNPHVELNILRALVLRQRYQMTYSEELRNLILEYSNKDEHFVSLMMDIQYNRYHKEVLSREAIEQELAMIK